jgi:hypothetical protein
MRALYCLIATLAIFGTLGPTARAGTIQPVKGVYSFHSYLTAVAGSCGVAAAGDERNGRLVYPGPLKPGASLSFGVADDAYLDVTLDTMPKTPAAGALTWAGQFSYKTYAFGGSITTGSGTFTAQFGYATADSFMIEFVPTASGCKKTIRIVAWLD